MYALLSMLVLEIRYQEMEKREAELLETDTEYDRMVVLGTEIQQIQDAIGKAPSTALVLNALLRHDCYSI